MRTQEIQQIAAARLRMTADRVLDEDTPDWIRHLAESKHPQRLEDRLTFWTGHLAQTGGVEL